MAQSNESTVVTEYKPQDRRSEAYQSEAALEAEFIKMLTEQSYDYLPIHCEEDLIKNLRKQLEELNHYQFSDSEWDRFFNQILANPKAEIVDKTRIIQEDHVQVLVRDDGSSKNITLIDKKNIHNNKLQVNGLEANLTLYKMTAKEKAEEQLAEEISAAFNRHHFKDIEFSSSLTGKKYKGTTADDGTLCIIEAESGVEIPNNSKPSKKAIIGQAIIDLGGETTKDDTLYQRYRKLTKLILEA